MGLYFFLHVAHWLSLHISLDYSWRSLEMLAKDFGFELNLCITAGASWEVTIGYTCPVRSMPFLIVCTYCNITMPISGVIYVQTGNICHQMIYKFTQQPIEHRSSKLNYIAGIVSCNCYSISILVPCVCSYCKSWHIFHIMCSLLALYPGSSPEKQGGAWVHG